MMQNMNPAVDTSSAVRKFTTTIPPGERDYTVQHDLDTVDVIVQSRIAGRIREGGISVVDANSIHVTFGGILNERLDLVIIG
jgi:hypothetical protein